MEIRDNDKICIIAPLSAKLDKRKISKIISMVINEKRNVALDLTYVQDCAIEFIEELKNLANKELSIFNIPSDIFVLFNIMNVDKSIKLYVSEQDFKENSRQLINRQFAIV
jgi:anti-anti-sigma regulatory factor